MYKEVWEASFVTCKRELDNASDRYSVAKIWKSLEIVVNGSLLKIQSTVKSSPQYTCATCYVFNFDNLFSINIRHSCFSLPHAALKHFNRENFQITVVLYSIVSACISTNIICYYSHKK